MVQNTENFNKELYELLKVRGHKPVPLNSKNQRVNASQEADVIEFTFTKDNEEFGKAWISIENSNNIKIYYDSEQQESPSDPTPGMDYDDTWTGLLKHLKQWALRRQLGFDLANKDRLGDDMKQRDYYRMKEKVAESKNRKLTESATYGEASRLIDFANKNIKDKNHPVFAAINELIDAINDNRTIDRSLANIKKILGPLMESYHPINKKTSYNDAVPSVKVILQHSRNLEEGEARFRNIAKIFLENVDGERFLAPTTKPGLARVYARHIAEGGLPNDERWNHIKSMCEDFAKMGAFVRATRNKEFNESAAELINEGTTHYHNIKESLRKMTTHRGYHAYFENYTPALMEDDIDESIASLFVQENIDPRIENVMPILAKLRKGNIPVKEVDELSQWADDVINEKLELSEISKKTAMNALDKAWKQDLAVLPRNPNKDPDEDRSPGIEDRIRRKWPEMEKHLDRKRSVEFGYDPDAKPGPARDRMKMRKNSSLGIKKKKEIIDKYGHLFDKPLAEELPLSEIGDTQKGKKVLGRYINRAASDLKSLGKDIQYNQDHEDYGSPDTWRTHRKADNRELGISRAVDRLTKEPVTEIGDTPAGKKVLGAYVNDAAADLDKQISFHQAALGRADKTSDAHHRRILKRLIQKRKELDENIEEVLDTPDAKWSYINKAIPSSVDRLVGKDDLDEARAKKVNAKDTTDRSRNRKMKMATDYEERAKKTKSEIKKNHYRKMADEIRSSIVGDEEVNEARAKKVNVEVTDKGAVYVDGTRITGRGTKWGLQNTVFQAKVPLDQVVQTLRDNGFENIRLDPQYSAEMGIQLDENLGPKQKKAGQLGPTEKITKKNPLRGKLVGANESLDQIIKLSGIKK